LVTSQLLELSRAAGSRLVFASNDAPALLPPSLLGQDEGGGLSLLSVFLGIVIGVAIGWAAAQMLAKALGARTLADARRDAEALAQNARVEAETIKKQIELDARNEVAQRREVFEKESSEIRAELKEHERRLTKREDNLDRKLDTLSTKESYLDKQEQAVRQREEQVEAKEAEAAKLLEDRRQLLETGREEQKAALTRITGMSEDEARKETLALVEREVRHEADQLIARVRTAAEEEAKDAALKITLQAIQRYASEHTADNTVTSIPIPSDDMKGRVIGREGRNIRAFEKASGVDLIVDDTPGVVVVSCFDPVRRAIAAEALRKLLDDGRIHPSRIEEVCEQMAEEINQRIIKFGKDASIEANIQGLSPKLSETMGRLHYRSSYGQNILRHSIEVAFLCQVIAEELGLDGELARRCGYLHDIGKALDHDAEGGHPFIGAEFAKKFNERKEVINAIAGHHNDVPSISPYTPIVMAADAISGARPGARRETLERYVKRLEQLESIATDIDGVNHAFAIQAGREVRVIVDPDRIDDLTCNQIARDIAKRVSEEMTFPGEIRVTVLREMRTVEYAR